MTAKKHLSNQNVEKAKGSGYLKRSLAVLGPGLITGAADDDPSGISTYSVAGAAYGYSTLWIALLTFPLMASIQLMCARLGMVTGRGLAAAVRMHYPNHGPGKQIRGVGIALVAAVDCPLNQSTGTRTRRE